MKKKFHVPNGLQTFACCNINIHLPYFLQKIMILCNLMTFIFTYEYRLTLMLSLINEVNDCHYIFFGERRNDKLQKVFFISFFLLTANLLIFILLENFYLTSLWIITSTKLLCFFIQTFIFCEWTIINARPLPSNRNNRREHVFSQIDLGALHNPLPNLAEITVNVMHYRP